MSLVFFYFLLSGSLPIPPLLSRSPPGPRGQPDPVQQIVEECRSEMATLRLELDERHPSNREDQKWRRKYYEKLGVIARNQPVNPPLLQVGQNDKKGWEVQQLEPKPAVIDLKGAKPVSQKDIDTVLF